MAAGRRGLLVEFVKNEVEGARLAGPAAARAREMRGGDTMLWK